MNDDDIIPMLPLKYWGFTKYGDSTNHISVDKFYEDSDIIPGHPIGTWEWLVGKDYNPNGEYRTTIKRFEALVSEGLKGREELYILDYSTDGKVNPHDEYKLEYSEIEKEYNRVIQELEDQGLINYCSVQIEGDGGLFSPYKVTVTESPAFLMKVLCNMAVCERYNNYLGQGLRVGVITGFDVKGKYRKAKLSFMLANIGGLAHPHTPETYYLIAHNKAKELS